MNSTDYIKIQKNKHGEWDFGVSGLVSTISKKEIESFRSICMVAFRVADNMWMREQERQHQPMQCNPQTKEE